MVVVKPIPAVHVALVGTAGSAAAAGATVIPPAAMVEVQVAEVTSVDVVVEAMWVVKEAILEQG